MATGPGKYDDACTKARLATRAEAVVLVIINGSKGSGFSVQASPLLRLQLPALLRDLADQIDEGAGNA